MNLVMIIPTYWTWADGPRRDDNAIFDHPTPLGSRGTLGRTLESLRRQSDRDFHLVVVAAVTERSLAEDTARAVRRIIETSSPGVDVSLFAERECEMLRERLERHGEADLAPLVGLSGYGEVRNAGLLAARAHGADAVLLIVTGLPRRS